MLSSLEAKTKLWSWSDVFTLEKCEVKIGSFSNHTPYQHILHKRACGSYKTVLGISFRWKVEASSLKWGSKKKATCYLLFLENKLWKVLLYHYILLTKIFLLFTAKLHVLPVASFFTLTQALKQTTSTEKMEVENENKKHKEIINHRFHCQDINKI